MSLSKGFKILGLFFVLFLSGVSALAVPADYTLEGEEDPSLEDPQVLDLEAELQGHRSLEQIGAEDAETTYYRATADELDRDLIAEIENVSSDGLSDNGDSDELQSELSTLQ